MYRDHWMMITASAACDELGTRQKFQVTCVYRYHWMMITAACDELARNLPVRKLAEGGQHGSSGMRLFSDSSSSSAFGIELVELVSQACKITTSR
jgi:hypothetical protein